MRRYPILLGKPFDQLQFSWLKSKVDLTFGLQLTAPLSIAMKERGTSQEYELVLNQGFNWGGQVLEQNVLPFPTSNGARRHLVDLPPPLPDPSSGASGAIPCRNGKSGQCFDSTV